MTFMYWPMKLLVIQHIRVAWCCSNHLLRVFRLQTQSGLLHCWSRLSESWQFFLLHFWWLLLSHHLAPCRVGIHTTFSLKHQKSSTEYEMSQKGTHDLYCPAQPSQNWTSLAITRERVVLRWSLALWMKQLTAWLSCFRSSEMNRSLSWTWSVKSHPSRLQM